MSKEYLNPPELFPSLQYGFSQVVTSGSGKLVFMSGQVGWNEDQEIIDPDDLGRQARQALKNVKIALEAAGGCLADVVSMRIYIVQHKSQQSGAISAALKEFFPGDRAPATTWIMVQGLASEDFLVEIEPIAVIEP